MKLLCRLTLVLFAVSCRPTHPELAAASTATSADALYGRPKTRVLILRHAEKADDREWNTDLKDPEGFDRADDWVDILGAYAPDTLFVSNLQRTQHTLQPTADDLWLTPIIRPDVAPSPDRPTVDDTKALANEILDDHAHETVAVCWHTPYVRDLAIALGVPAAEVPEWGHSTFDHLWKVTIYRDGTAKLADLTPLRLTSDESSAQSDTSLAPLARRSCASARWLSVWRPVVQWSTPPCINVADTLLTVMRRRAPARVDIRHEADRQRHITQTRHTASSLDLAIGCPLFLIRTAVASSSAISRRNHRPP